MDSKQKYNWRRGKKGFSLAELIVVIAIISIMTVVIMVSYIGMRSQNALKTSGRNFAAIVRELQNNALNGKRPSSSSIACGFGFQTTTGTSGKTTTYDLYYNSYTQGSGNSCAGEGGTTAISKGYNHDIHGSVAPTNVYSASNSFGNNTTAPASTGVYFTLPTGTMYDNAGNILSSSTINISLNSQNYPICIYTGGRVEEPGIGQPCP